MSQISKAVQSVLLALIVCCAFVWLTQMAQQQGYHQDRFKSEFSDGAVANAVEDMSEELKKPSPTLAFIAGLLCWISIQLELLRAKK